MTWGPAGPDDALALRDLEREANVVGLAHVFPAAEFPFPDDAVLARWRTTLADPAVVTELYADPEPVAYVSYDTAGRLRHLAVHPSRWGSGLATDGVERAVAAIRAAGRTPVLWVLDRNARARRLYARLGWEPTGREQPAEWPPHPVELQLRMPESGHGR